MSSSYALVTRSRRRRLVLAVAALAVGLAAGTVSHAQSQDAGKDRDVIQLTIDVAEDLSGKFVPTFVKPEHTQPERGGRRSRISGPCAPTTSTPVGFAT